MRKNKCLRSALAILCSISMLFGSVGIVSRTVKAAESLPTYFKHVTPKQFGIADGTYETEQKSTDVSFESLDEVLLEADIMYPGTGGLHYMYDATKSTDNTLKFNYLGGEIRLWNTLTDSIWIGGQEIANDKYVPLYPNVAIDGISSFENVEFRLSISTEYVDYDHNGEENDIKLGVWFDEKLYDNQYFYLKDCTAFCKPYFRVNMISVFSPSPMLPNDYTYVTPLDFGIVYDTYAGDATTPQETHHTATPLVSMNKVLFETKITFGKSSKLYYTQRSGSVWNGLTLALNSEGMLNFNNALANEYVYVGDEAYISAGINCYKFQPSIAISAETTSFLDLPFTLAITTEFVAYDGSEANDLQLGVWFNDELYNNEYIYITDCKDVCEQGLFLYRAGEGSIVLESPIDLEREETEERYNLSDGPYLISGTGTILVNGVECKNGATLTEPGNYRIVSDNGGFVRNVELYDTGKKSMALTHEENVMPIAGFHGPISGVDANGETYDFVTEETYALFEEAGINLINYIPKSWSAMSNRKEIIQNLTYAEEHGIGLYVWDSRLKNTDLRATTIAEHIAPYSQYHSFKGIFIADEPGTDTYQPDRPVLIDDCAALSQAINGYCNLNGYINLLPLPMLVASETDADVAAYEGYVDEYLREAKPKMLSYDRYVFTNRGMSSYFINLSIARQKFIDTGTPFWTYVQAGNWVKNPELRPIGTPFEGEFMWNVNTCLAYGARGVQYYPLIEPYSDTYTYERYGILDVNGETTDWYTYAKKINKHIAAIDEVLLQSESKDILAVGTNAQATTGITTTCYGNLESVILDEANTEGTVIGAFDYQGKDAFYVVNFDMKEEASITLKFQGNDACAYRMIQNAVTSYGEGNTCTLTVPAGEAVLIILEDYTPSYDGMQCLSPIDFGFSYKEYEGTTDGTAKETKGSCAKISSMNKVLMKTNITFGESTQLFYMKSSDGADGHWTGLTFALSSDGTLNFRNPLTYEDVYVKEVAYVSAGYNNYKFYPTVAFDETITSFLDLPFNLTITSEFVDYDNNGDENDLKLGVYFNDKLYDDAYIYIKNCKSVCKSSMFLYRPGTGSITLATPMIYGMEMQPEITDSIAMNFVATLDPTLLQTETPYMTFQRNGKVLKNVIGTPKEVGGSVYIFTYPDVMAQNLADTVTATIQVGSNTKTYQCSMMEYCVHILQSETMADSDGFKYSSKQLSALKDLIVDLVQYATEVQKFRGNLTEETWLTTSLEKAVPNFAITYDKNDAELSALKDLMAVDSKLIGTNAGAYKWKNVGLVISNKTKIRAQFIASDVSKLTVKVSVNGMEQEVAFEETSEAGVYVVDFTDIRAYEYDQEVTIQFYEDGIATGAELHYSVNTYLKEMYTIEEVKALLLAIHNYGTASQTYISFR